MAKDRNLLKVGVKTQGIKTAPYIFKLKSGGRLCNNPEAVSALVNFKKEKGGILWGTQQYNRNKYLQKGGKLATNYNMGDNPIGALGMKFGDPGDPPEKKSLFSKFFNRGKKDNISSSTGKALPDLYAPSVGQIRPRTRDELMESRPNSGYETIPDPYPDTTWGKQTGENREVDPPMSYFKTKEGYESYMNNKFLKSIC